MFLKIKNKKSYPIGTHKDTGVAQSILCRLGLPDAEKNYMVETVFAQNLLAMPSLKLAKFFFFWFREREGHSCSQETKEATSSMHKSDPC